MGRKRGSRKLTCYIFRQAGQIWMRPWEERQGGRNIGIVASKVPLFSSATNFPWPAPQTVGAGIGGLLVGKAGDTALLDKVWDTSGLETQTLAKVTGSGPSQFLIFFS